MQTILLIHGPNLNKLGERDTSEYGTLSLADIEALFAKEAAQKGFATKSFQSNHEGALIDFIQSEAHGAVAIVINPGALTHYSYALYDALVDAGLPAVEVHLSNINVREDWRKISVTGPACIAQISGSKDGYAEALRILAEHISK